MDTTAALSHLPASPILELVGVNVAYDHATPALKGISFRLVTGERVAVVGPNGAGKSTLFKVIAGILKPTEGVVKVAHSSPGKLICIAYVPQRTQVDWQFPANVADVVMMGRVGKIGFFHRPSHTDWDYVYHCLDTVGLTPLARRQIGQLSGGQQQRVFIARALAQEAELMLMDEPFSGLDLPSQEDIFHILDDLQSQLVTVMVATHDLDLAANRFDRVMLLNHQLLGLGQPPEVFTVDRLLSAYGVHLH